MGEDHFKTVDWQRPKLSGVNFSLLSDFEKEGLGVEFSNVEVWEAINVCYGNKAPGPDGLNLNFFKKNWEVIKEDFMAFIIEFHKDASIVRDLNSTFIALIPKVKRPTSMGDFRPISLVGSMYKILSKMAFVEGRQILDNVVIVEEIINKWKREEDGGVVIKLDFEKAYDIIDHSFLDDVLGYMGFEERWRGWIREGVSSPFMSVLVNGSPTSQFGIKRGLRQGDPLSPFLFNIVAEGFSRLLVKATNVGLFEDDKIIFTKTKLEYLCNIKRILRCFEFVSGLKIKFFFKSCCVRVGKKAVNMPMWVATLKCKATIFPINYLGIPLGSRPSSLAFWRPVVDRIKDRLKPWKRKFLTKSGRVVLIKAMLSSILTYFMSIFKIPLGITLNIEKLQRGFLWGDGIEKKKIHAVNWETLCAPNSIKEWVSLFTVRESKRAWSTLFFAMVCTIWEFCNSKVFNNKEPDLTVALDSIRFRVAWWFKHHGCGSLDPLTSLLQCVSQFCKDQMKSKKRESEAWIPPGLGSLKFNVDGSAKGQPVRGWAVSVLLKLRSLF
ncbi:hypothetical protein Ddye_025880 [Dipteronia dyeriana]|uniref:Reverse transcriptase domain-containing protein n=1 Tax=Dipteronia dyeriana TaxID=168575 RepID=A0AAD9WQ07_9ROSI|nr:hypothetical protein Ddye_025880 [Dipteronia dyeriana]